MNNPPKFILSFLRWFCHPDLLPSIEGDLMELYQERITNGQKQKANALLFWDVVRLFRPSIIRPAGGTYRMNHYGLFRHNLIMALRMLRMDWTHSILNIIGLAFGIATCMFLLLYVQFERSYDKFHSNYENIYRVNYLLYEEGELSVSSTQTVPRVGPFMLEKMPEIKAFARAYFLPGIMTYGDTKFRENRIYFADPQFLEMLTFPLLGSHSETALTEPDKVVITESIAKKYFGDEEPVGKVIRFNGWGANLEVSAVAKDVPENSHFKFDFLISFETLVNKFNSMPHSVGMDKSWEFYSFSTYVQLEKGTDLEEFGGRFTEHLSVERGKSFAEKGIRQEFPLQPIADIHLHSNLLHEAEPDEQGDGKSIWLLTTLAFFVLIIAWVNYTNLATAKSIDRAKEVGVRKVMGARRNQLSRQFLAESFVINLLAFVLGIVLVIIGIRYFNFLTENKLNFAFLSDTSFWVLLGVTYFVTSILTGLYPAFVLSSFRPVHVLKGKLTSYHSGLGLKKGLVMFQFIASISLISATLIIHLQVFHLKNFDNGFDTEQILVVSEPSIFEKDWDLYFQSTSDAFKNELLGNAEIISISSSSDIPGAEIHWTGEIKSDRQGEGALKTIDILGVDYDYFSLYGIEMIAGRNYLPSHRSDSESLIINEAAVDFLGFESSEQALDQTVVFWDEQMTIIGVVSNYNQVSAKSLAAPMVFPLLNDDSGYFTIKIQSDNYLLTLDRINKVYESYFPGNPMDYFFLDDYVNRHYGSEEKFGRLFTVFSAFAILVACLGLYGLSTFNVKRKSKEIGIRKVLGASVARIVLLLSKEYLIIMLLANIISWPIMFVLMEKWLEDYANRIGLSWWIFVISGLVGFVLVAIAIGSKSLQTASANPVDSLRDE